MRTETVFIAGLLTAGYCVAGLFFLRFWNRSRDRLFALFATAFFLLAVQRVALVAASSQGVDTTWIYAVRLLAFLVIIWAIVDKNRR